jgi:hypothetical protein
MDPDTKDALKQLDSLLAHADQSWLFGAGISYSANIPLMGPLTQRVFAKAASQGGRAKEVLDAVKEALPDGCHIEHILSHLGDLAAVAERSREKKVKVGSIEIEQPEFSALHADYLRWIAETIRWGFVPANGDTAEKVGSRQNPIVTVENHSNFVSALFNRGQAGLAERRGPVRFFTVNYDTLIEDALAIQCVSYWDGFAGGALAFRCHHFGDEEPTSDYRAFLIKLHGSIDWHLGKDGRVWRVREGDLYPEKTSRVLIYPQATKYIATQRDPFASQFDLFRRSLADRGENVLAVCGYSFGDEHINQELELALDRPDNKTTILAFVSGVNPTLSGWRKKPWANRLYIISSAGIYVGERGPLAPPKAGATHDWWKFDGVTKLLNTGAEAYVV